MAIRTTIFRPNSQSTDVTYVSANGFERATAGGVSSRTEAGTVTTLSNETATPWHGDPKEMVVACARWIAHPDGNFNYRARSMLRFVFRDVFIDAESIESGYTPLAAWWPLVTGARLKWRTGVGGGLQTVPTVITESDMLVRVGRTLYTPTGANEEPFGATGAESSTTFTNAATFGTAEATLVPGDYTTPDHSDKTLVLSATCITTWLQTITGITNDFLDFSFRLAQEGVDGANVNRILAAYDPFPPTLEIDFDVDQTITLDTLTLNLSPGDVAITPGARTVELDTLPLAAAPQDIAIATGGTSVELQTLELAADPQDAAIAAGAVSVELDTLGLILAPGTISTEAQHTDPPDMRLAVVPQERRYVIVKHESRTGAARGR